jgi:predicted transcriptional regulator of viral defense system
MAAEITQMSRSGVWTIARQQHGIVTRGQLTGLGFTRAAIRHRVANGRLHRIGSGIYAVGRPELSRRGAWMAAVLSCGGTAALSHESAAALWGIRDEERGRIEVSVPMPSDPRRAGVVLHRRARLGEQDVTRRCGIPVTNPVCTLVDLATRLRRGSLEAAINEADKGDLVDPDGLRVALDGLRARRGAAALRRTLDAPTFTMTDSRLEQLFLPLVRAAGLPPPETGRYVNGFRVDFYWPELGLVVETDGLRYHRTPAQQAKDRLRDQAHTAAGLTPLRFTRAQVVYEPRHVESTLTAVALRLRARSGP